MPDHIKDFDDTNYEKPPRDEPLTAETWFGYWITEYENNIHNLVGHCNADERIAKKLTKLLATTQSYDELKSELLTVIKNLNDYTNDVSKKWSGPDAESWGFPVLA